MVWTVGLRGCGIRGCWELGLGFKKWKVGGFEFGVLCFRMIRLRSLLSRTA